MHIYINIFVVVQVLIKNNFLPFNIAFLALKKRNNNSNTHVHVHNVLASNCVCVYFRIKFLSFLYFKIICSTITLASPAESSAPAPVALRVFIFLCSSRTFLLNIFHTCPTSCKSFLHTHTHTWREGSHMCEHTYIHTCICMCLCISDLLQEWSSSSASCNYKVWLLQLCF